MRAERIAKEKAQAVVAVRKPYGKRFTQKTISSTKLRFAKIYFVNFIEF